jgi:hypothetical protein
MTVPAPLAPKAPSFLRPALALLAGLGIFVALVFLATVVLFVIMRVKDPAHPSVALLLTQLVINAASALVAGFATGRITWGRSLYTIFLLAVILSMSSLIPVLKGTVGVGDPSWFQLGRPAVILFGILLGGLLERRQSNSVPLPA